MLCQPRQPKCGKGNGCGESRVSQKERHHAQCDGDKRKNLKKLRDFRAGIEGNISELKRAFGAGKAMWKGESGFAAFVWASVISYNLAHIMRLDSG